MEGHVPWICLPEGDPQQYTPATHTEAVGQKKGKKEARGPLGGLASLSLTTEGSWIHLGGRVAKPLISPLTPVPPIAIIRH